MRFPRHLAVATLLVALSIFLPGCASIQAPLPPSLELPKPPNDLRAVRKGDRVYLFWSVPIQSLDRQLVRRPGPTRICRGLEASMSTCGTPVGNVPPPNKVELQKNAPGYPQASFIDKLPPELQQQNPGRMITYAVDAMNRNARSAGLSNQVQVPLAPTLPPPPNFHAEVKPEGVDLAWDCEASPVSPGVHFLYRIYRRSPDSGVDLKLADAQCPGGHYKDLTIEWQKPYEYRIAVITQVETAAECAGAASGAKCPEPVTVDGADSPPQRIFTQDVYPPAVPSGLQAVYSGPGQAPFVDLLWAPNTEADLTGYNVYRRESGTQPTKINSDLVKTPAFRDTNVSAGKTYWYSVSAVDARGNESAHSEESSESVP